MATPFDYYSFISGSHNLYQRYIAEWQLSTKSYYGGVEYKNGQYLKHYSVDSTTPSEVINTYDLDSDGIQTNQYTTTVNVNSQQDLENSEGYSNNFYQEKIDNVPVYPYARLYTSEYNAILFRTPPVRNLPNDSIVSQFVQDVNGEGESINEFMSKVDVYTTVNGVAWVSVIKPLDSETPRWKMHMPQDVHNWEYRYTPSGELVLDKIVIRLSIDDYMEIKQYITPDTIHTIFIPQDEDNNYGIPDGATYFETDDDEDFNYYVVEQENELGYVPVLPIYQSTKIYNGIGHTPMFDIANIQRSVYSDSAEIYSTVSYSIHPVNIVDEETANMNDGVSAEPGAIMRVPSAINGVTNYVFEFKSPDTSPLRELRELIDQKIEKMNVVAMIRTEELIKASRSGAQLEQYDSKLEAFIRRKATSLENAEFKLWNMTYDWMGRDIPSDLTVSYNRLYNQRGLQQEADEVKQIMGMLRDYEDQYMTRAMDMDKEIQDYPTVAEAIAEARRLGGSGYHAHTGEDGVEIYMPFATHDEYEQAVADMSGADPQEEEFISEMKEQLRERMKQLITSSYSVNSL